MPQNRPKTENSIFPLLPKRGRNPRFKGSNPSNTGISVISRVMPREAQTADGIILVHVSHDVVLSTGIQRRSEVWWCILHPT